MHLNTWVYQKLIMVTICFPFFGSYRLVRASLVAQMVKNPPAMWETWVQSLGWEDRLEIFRRSSCMATHSSILAWRVPWTEEPGAGLQSMGSQRVRHDGATKHAHTDTHTKVSTSGNLIHSLM